MIAHLKHASSTADVLADLYGTDERSRRIRPRLIGGDGHGAPVDLLAEVGPLALGQALDAPVALLAGRAPQRPTWLCSVRSDPCRPDLSDEQWAAVARRLVAATGIAPYGDPDACRWIALRLQPRQVHVVATVAREDGGLHHGYRDVFRLQSECHRIAAELGHLSTASPSTTPRSQEALVPAPITISSEPSGSVVVKGANDDVAAMLLKHAGFQQIDDWHGRRHRLPTTTPAAQRIAVSSHAAEMLRAARYDVELAPILDAAQASTPVRPLEHYAAGAALLQITDAIRAAEDGTGLRDVAEQLLHPEHGALERVREALEAVGQHITDLDDEAYELADRFGVAADFVSTAQAELRGSETEVEGVGAQTGSSVWTEERSLVQRAALAVSPAVVKTEVASTATVEVAEARVNVRPSRASGPRR
ncbi:hypothetical protein MHW47_01000 [Streptomyces sp. OfavH-34-F]|uniref:hypothetical protein n=1 Tax=Streptomyces sp. OfavH-34-F TaxID=2917760 RepID=UPI001EF35AEB|nr:hypothetical protein [Streptomyces sp. OfavH-34-F]MCG7523031.1 hypothetical protein [Streptomyces sp. OfavH-34-F]